MAWPTESKESTRLSARQGSALTSRTRGNRESVAGKQQEQLAIAKVEFRNATLEARVAELEERNAALVRFAAEASHELTEPLIIAEVSARLVMHELGEDLDVFLRARLEALCRVSADARLLVETLLSDAGLSEHGPEVRQVDVGEVVEDAMALVAHRVERLGTDVVIETMPTLTTAPGLLSIIVRNLLLNAVKYGSRDQGRIRIHAHPTGAGVQLCVASAGPPIDAAGTERLFRPYERGDERRNEAGTGLGLAICSRIAERLGGRMGVTRIRGGNSFFVMLPMAVECWSASPR